MSDVAKAEVRIGESDSGCVDVFAAGQNDGVDSCCADAIAPNSFGELDARCDETSASLCRLFKSKRGTTFGIAVSLILVCLVGLLGIQRKSDKTNFPILNLKVGTSNGQPYLGVLKQGAVTTAITWVPPFVHTLGNITPYRRYVVKELGKCLPEEMLENEAIVLVEISRDGTVKRADMRLCECSDETAEICAELLPSIGEIRFNPLPDWYKGESIPFLISIPGAKEAPGQESIVDYRAKVLSLISQKLPWDPAYQKQVVEVTILSDGKVKRLSIPPSLIRDRQIAKAIIPTKFDPLPAWYRADAVEIHFGMNELKRN